MHKYWLYIGVVAFLGMYLFHNGFGADDTQQGMGISLYFPPLSENPKVGKNFTVSLKVDSLFQKVIAINGELSYNQDKLQIIGISKVGSVINLWRQEPTYRSVAGKITFKGDVGGSGFLGNGGTVFSIIFKAKSSGIASILWNNAEAFADSGKKTNIISDLENSDFTIDNAPSDSAGIGYTILMIINIILVSIIGIAVLHHFFRNFLMNEEKRIIKLEHLYHKDKDH